MIEKLNKTQLIELNSGLRVLTSYACQKGKLYNKDYYNNVDACDELAKSLSIRVQSRIFYDTKLVFIITLYP